jgi:hypothetical protein
MKRNNQTKLENPGHIHSSRNQIFLYLICHDFRKIKGRIKIFEKCTSGAVPHGGRTWGTALGVPPTVGSTGWWGQVPAAVGHDGRIPSAVTHSGRSPSAAAHGGKALALWATALAPSL